MLKRLLALLVGTGVTISTAVAIPAAADTATAYTGTLKAHFIDVGQADSELIELPNGQAMLIDAGNNPDGIDVVNYIKSTGHTKIDYLIGTHPHEDHIGGLDTVINSLEIGQVIMPKATTNTQTYADVLMAIKNKGLKVTAAKAGLNVLNDKNLRIDLLAPVGDNYSNLNNYSVITKITYGSTSFLFTGDAEQESENQITGNVKADVLKVGHHGSDTSTGDAFLKKVSPKIAVIEVGAGNSYGHPADVTLSKLQNIGATVYRTDLDGTIVISSDGKTITADKNASPVKTNAPPASSSVQPSAPVASVTAPPAAAETNSATVYVTNTGKKYHRSGCRYLSKSKIPISKDDARAQGYGACSVCNP